MQSGGGGGVSEATTIADVVRVFSNSFRKLAVLSQEGDLDWCSQTRSIQSSWLLQSTFCHTVKLHSLWKYWAVEKEGICYRAFNWGQQHSVYFLRVGEQGKRYMAHHLSRASLPVWLWRYAFLVSEVQIYHAVVSPKDGTDLSKLKKSSAWKKQYNFLP